MEQINEAMQMIAVEKVLEEMKKQKNLLCNGILRGMNNY